MWEWWWPGMKELLNKHTLKSAMKRVEEEEKTASMFILSMDFFTFLMFFFSISHKKCTFQKILSMFTDTNAWDNELYARSSPSSSSSYSSHRWCWNMSSKHHIWIFNEIFFSLLSFRSSIKYFLMTHPSPIHTN